MGSRRGLRARNAEDRIESVVPDHDLEHADPREGGPRFTFKVEADILEIDWTYETWALATGKDKHRTSEPASDELTAINMERARTEGPFFDPATGGFWAVGLSDADLLFLDNE